MNTVNVRYLHKEWYLSFCQYKCNDWENCLLSDSSLQWPYEMICSDFGYVPVSYHIFFKTSSVMFYDLILEEAHISGTDKWRLQHSLSSVLFRTKNG